MHIYANMWILDSVFQIIKICIPFPFETFTYLSENFS